MDQQLLEEVKAGEKREVLMELRWLRDISVVRTVFHVFLSFSFYIIMTNQPDFTYLNIQMPSNKTTKTSTRNKKKDNKSS